MLNFQGLSLWLAIFCTRWQLWLLLWCSRYRRKRYLYQSASLFQRISRLTLRQKTLEQKLLTLQKGDTP